MNIGRKPNIYTKKRWNNRMVNIDVIDVAKIIKNQKLFFSTHKTLDTKFRKSQLKTLKRLLKENEELFFDVLKKDLGKSEYESFGSEIAQVLDEIDFALKNLNSWVEKKRVSAAWVSFPSRHYVYSVPYGVAYIIGAWNFPVLLTLTPLVGAIATGNCVILKPSELAQHTSNLLEKLFVKYFDEDYIKVVQGDAEISQQILNEDLDYVFFTGSSRVGKIIMKKAAERLIPVTLELGGKSPCIVDEDANLEISAKRVIFGKMLNTGQACVAPDYLLVHEKIADKFVQLLKERILNIYGNEPLQHEDIGKIINDNHFLRLVKYLTNGEVFHGGQVDKEQLKISPTLLVNVNWSDEVMNEEIFGPILPILTFSNLNDTIDLLNKFEKPLAAYYFSANKKKQEGFIKNLQCGGGMINDTMFHFGNPELPVGGIGNSGLGQYHGKYSFDTFSHKKSIVKKPYYLDLDLRYPPFKNKLKYLRAIFKL